MWTRSIPTPTFPTTWWRRCRKSDRRPRQSEPGAPATGRIETWSGSETKSDRLPVRAQRTETARSGTTVLEKSDCPLFQGRTATGGVDDAFNQVVKVSHERRVIRRREQRPTA